MRRRRPRAPRGPDLFGLWCESLSCYSPDWHAFLDTLPSPGPDQDGMEMEARAWLSWPGRPAWLTTSPAGRVSL